MTEHGTVVSRKNGLRYPKYKCVACGRLRMEPKMTPVDWCCNECEPGPDRDETWEALQAVAKERDHLRALLLSHNMCPDCGEPLPVRSPKCANVKHRKGSIHDELCPHHEQARSPQQVSESKR